MGPLPNEVGALVTKGTEKAELLNTFASYSLLRLALESQTLGAFPWLRIGLGKPNTHKFMSPGGIHP